MSQVRRVATDRLRLPRAPILEWSPNVAVQLETLRPDLAVIASFPQILGQSILEAPGHGTLNVHMSLLPQHRGPDPIFWTYWSDDACTGVSVHWATPEIDAGDLVAREAMPLARGRPSRDLYLELSRRAAAMIHATVRSVAAGTVSSEPQHDAGASYESLRDRAGAVLPFAEWPSERVWHVLSGLGDQYHSLLKSPDGAVMPHGRASACEATGAREPGRIDRTGEGYLLHCRDGVVHVALPGAR